MNPIEAAKQKREEAPQAAHDQAAENGGFVADDIYVAPDGSRFVVPLMDELDDDQQERFNAVQHLFSNCDRVPDIEFPGYTDETTTTAPDGTVTVSRKTYPPRTVPGGYKSPYQKDGELITPAYNAQIVKALLGDDEFDKFRAAKGKSSEFARMFSGLVERVQERESADPKSEGSAGDMAEVSD